MTVFPSLCLELQEVLSLFSKCENGERKAVIGTEGSNLDQLQKTTSPRGLMGILSASFGSQSKLRPSLNTCHLSVVYHPEPGGLSE